MVLCLLLAACGPADPTAWRMVTGPSGPDFSDSLEIGGRFFPTAAELAARELELSGPAGADLDAALEEHDLDDPGVVARAADGGLLRAAWQTDVRLSDGGANVVVGLGPEGRIVGVVVRWSADARLEDARFLGQFAGRRGAEIRPERVSTVGGAPAEDCRRIAAAVRRAARTVEAGLLEPARRSR